MHALVEPADDEAGAGDVAQPRPIGLPRRRCARDFVAEARDVGAAAERPLEHDHLAEQVLLVDGLARRGRARVVEGAAVGAPGRSELAPDLGDRLADVLAAGDVAKAHRAELGVGGRGQERDPFAVGRRAPSIDRFALAAVRQPFVGIVEQPRRAAEATAHVELGQRLVALALGVEDEPAGGALQAADVNRHAGVERLDALVERAERGDAVEQLAREIALARDPRAHLGIVELFEIAIGIGDRDALVGRGDGADGRLGWHAVGVSARKRQDECHDESGRREAIHGGSIRGGAGAVACAHHVRRC